jgi:tetratricopeptide (TPR) repeat protein
MALGVLALAGCEPPRRVDLTFERGVQLLSDGDPRAAIPFLTQVIASAPDGPEPHAMLALACALDLQSDRAVLQARQVRRPEGAPPGWEAIAVAIAFLTEHRPLEAAAHLEATLVALPEGGYLRQATLQWLVLAYACADKPDKAMESLQQLAATDSTRLTASLWAVLLLGYDQRVPEASQQLRNAAAEVAVRAPGSCDADTFIGRDPQELYDVTLAQLAEGKLDKGQALLELPEGGSSLPYDLPVWRALITAATGRWRQARSELRAACQAECSGCRGVANHLLSVVYALEGQPEAMIASMLAGQRLLGSRHTLAHVVTEPRPEPVWLSDNMW